MKNDCQKTKEQILEFISGTLPAQDVVDLRNHLEKCPSCSSYLDALRSDDKDLADFAESMQPAIARLENNVIDALRAKQPVKIVKSTSLRTIIKNPITKLAAAAIVVIAIGLFISHRGPDEKIGKPVTSRVERSPAEMMTLISLNVAYRRGGMEAVEEQCLKALGMVAVANSNIKQLQIEYFKNNGI